MNPKAKGSRNELKTKRILEQAGYYCIKAGGSLGLFDIISISRTGLRFIQVKTNHNASPAERETIQLFNNLPRHSTKEIWIWYDYKKTPEINYL